MERILFVGHLDSEDDFSRIQREALSVSARLAAELEGELILGIIGGSRSAAGRRTRGCGAGRRLHIEGETFAQARYSTDAAAVTALIEACGPTLVLAGSTSRLSRVMAGIACRVDGRIDSHVCGVKVDGGNLVVSRWYYRQRMKAELSRSGRPWFLLLDGGVAEAWQCEGEPADFETLNVTAPATRTEVQGVVEPPAGEQTIRPEADLLFVAGAGWTKTQADGKTHAEQAEELILGFLTETKASLGGSKSMVDLASEGQKILSFMTHLNQIGQTGATPRHPKGLATCCHGEEPHVVGWRFIGERRAVNTDPNCGWAQGKADVLYVADAFEVLEKVNLLLRES